MLSRSGTHWGCCGCQTEVVLRRRLERSLIDNPGWGPKTWASSNNSTHKDSVFSHVCSQSAPFGIQNGHWFFQYRDTESVGVRWTSASCSALQHWLWRHGANPHIFSSCGIGGWSDENLSLRRQEKSTQRCWNRDYQFFGHWNWRLGLLWIQIPPIHCDTKWRHDHWLQCLYGMHIPRIYWDSK